MKIAERDDISDSTKSCISCALAHLTSSHDSCPMIVQHSALPILINLLEEDNLVIKKVAAGSTEEIDH